jgi:hypothetical protein
MGESKDAADVTETPEGLDVVVTVPGTIVGSHDLQGTDGEERTDRPGEILGTPVDVEERTAARERENARGDFVRDEVDRANREELPKLGGSAADDWEPVKGGPAASAAAEKAAAKAASTTTRAATTATAPAAPIPAAAPATAPRADDAPATRAARDGIKVSPKVDKGKG